MHAQQIQNEFRIRRVIFGPTGMEGFAILGHHGGIHGIEVKLGILHQKVEETAGFLFYGDGDLLVRIALVDVLQPSMERLGRVGQFVMGAVVGGGLILPQVMRGISPINGNQQRVFRPCFRVDRPWRSRGGRSFSQGTSRLHLSKNRFQGCGMGRQNLCIHHSYPPFWPGFVSAAAGRLRESLIEASP